MGDVWMKFANILVNMSGVMFFLIIFLTIPGHKTTKVNEGKPTKEVIKIVKKKRGRESSISILASMGEKRYVIQKNDTIIAIAAKFYIRPDQLMQANWIKNKNYILHPGETLIIPNIRWEIEYGYASWYGDDKNNDTDHVFHGKPMANGRVYNMFDLYVIAHRKFPLNSFVRLTDEGTGKSIVVKAEDRGPFTKGPNGNFLRQVDLSYALAVYFGSVQKGTIYLKIEPLGMTL